MDIIINLWLVSVLVSIFNFILYDGIGQNWFEFIKFLEFVFGE